MAITVPTPSLSLELVRGSLYRLRNTSGSDVTIEAIDNKVEFFRIDLQPGTTLSAGRSTDFIIVGANGKPVPGDLVLRLADIPQTVVVAIPPK